MIGKWRTYASKIARSAQQVLGRSVEVYVFGSALRGESAAASDIDILIVVDHPLASVSERNRIRMATEDAAGLPNVQPFEMHVVDRHELEIYMRHIRSSMLKV